MTATRRGATATDHTTAQIIHTLIDGMTFARQQKHVIIAEEITDIMMAIGYISGNTRSTRLKALREESRKLGEAATEYKHMAIAILRDRYEITPERAEAMIDGVYHDFLFSDAPGGQIYARVRDELLDFELKED